MDIGPPVGSGDGRSTVYAGLPNSQGAMTRAQVRYVARTSVAWSLVGGDAATDRTVANPARAATVLGLLRAAGEPFPAPLLADRGMRQVLAAAQRFAALPVPARRAWLAAHLPALRANTLTLGQLP